MGISKRRIVLFGATGSIGKNTLKVLRRHPQLFELIAIAAKTQYRGLAAIAKEFNVPNIAIYDTKAYAEAKKSGLFTKNQKLFLGEEGLLHLASLQETDIFVMAIVGTIGLKPTLAAIERGATVALATKEILVMAGAYVIASAKKHNATLLPIDSEHNAIFQCLQGQAHKSVKSLILTASGGPFKDYSYNQMRSITPKEALKHPTWCMGPKVTTDCATLANKGLELIEAHWFFDVPPEKLQVVVHPQSVVHSFVQFIDGSTLCQLAPPSMTFAIQYGLLYPERHESVDPSIDFSQALSLNFHPPDLDRFPCLRLAQDSLKAGGLASTVFNAANTVAAQAFLSNRIPFLSIPNLIDKTLQKCSYGEVSSLEDIMEAHNHAEAIATHLIDEF